MISDKIISPLQSVNPGGAEKVDWDPSSKIAYVITGEYTDDKGGQVVAVDYSDGYDKGKVVAEYYLEGDVSDVRVSSKGLIAASVFDRDTREGKVQFFTYDASSAQLVDQGSVDVGYQPDQLSFTKNGKKLVTADEGEPLDFYGSDEPGQNPPGSISIITVDNDTPADSSVNTLYFTKSNSYYENNGVRLYGPEKAGDDKFGRLDIEPEYVGITGNKYALVALQENNALAKVNLKKEKITGVFGLGLKDWTGIPVDTTDRDDGYNPSVKENFYGARMPDGIDTFKIKSGDKKQTFFISPNEGDGRVRPDDVNFEAEADGVYSYGTNSTGDEIDSFVDPLSLTETIYIYDQPGVGSEGDFEAEEGDEFFITKKYGVSDDDEFWSDELRADDLADFGDVSQYDSQIIAEGRLKNLIDQNDSVTGKLVGFGGRGFSIHDDNGRAVYDSGNLTEEIAAELGYYPNGRSDDKGTEPETVEYFSLGKKKNKRHFIAVALERCYNNGDDDELGTIVPIFEVVDLDAAENDDRVKHVATLQSPESLSPEGLLFVKDTKNSGHMFVTNEVSQTLDTYAISLSDLA